MAIDDKTRARARKWVSERAEEDRAAALKRLQSPTPKKAPIITKKQLADSGLSLRDYMNKQQGKVRRGYDPTAGEAQDKVAQAAADAIDPGQAMSMKSYKPRRSSALSDVVQLGTNINYENPNTSNMSMKRGGAVKKYAHGGSVRGNGIAQRGKTKGRYI